MILVLNKVMMDFDVLVNIEIDEEKFVDNEFVYWLLFILFCIC